jgi:hypothetical protein
MSPFKTFRLDTDPDDFEQLGLKLWTYHSAALASGNCDVTVRLFSNLLRAIGNANA